MNTSNVNTILNDNDISTMKLLLENRGIEESKFEQILEEISAKTEELEEEYDKELHIFPEHNFKKLAFEKVLTEFEEENINVPSSNLNPTFTSSTSTQNENKEADSIEKSSKSSVISSVPSSEHLNHKNEYDDIISEMSQKYDVPFDLIKLVINTESSFNPDAVSSSGAIGLMQLMPATAEWLGVDDAFDPRENIEGGTKYLSYLLDRYDGKLELALAAYNAGPGNVDKYKGIPPFTETQNYVKKILG